MADFRLSSKEPRRSPAAAYFDELPLDGIPVPEPCTTAEMEFALNKEAAKTYLQHVDVSKFPLSTDILIVKALYSRQLVVAGDADPVIIFNKLTGQVYAQVDSGDGYKVINMGVGKQQFQLYVHRIVYYASLIDRDRFEMLGSKFDIHHIDGNKENNHACNLEPVPRALHSCRGAYANAVCGARMEAQMIATRINSSNAYAASLVKILRVCLAQFPHYTNRKFPVAVYFANLLHVSRDYVYQIASWRRCRLIPDASLAQRDAIIAHYHWIFDQLEENDYHTYTELVEPEGFEHLILPDEADEADEAGEADENGMVCEYENR